MARPIRIPQDLRPHPSRADLRVPMREIPLSAGEPPVRLYDTSGPFTDPQVDIDLKRGLPPAARDLDPRAGRRGGADRATRRSTGAGATTIPPSAACASPACGARCAPARDGA